LTTVSKAEQATLSALVLAVDGVLYASSPDNIWAVDARDGSIPCGTPGWAA
jgi:hypothetical protein